VHFLHYTTVEKGYMNQQYEYMQELVKLSDRPPFKAECEGDLQKIDNPPEKMRKCGPVFMFQTNNQRPTKLQSNGKNVRKAHG
jgi:hypothetical protein